MANSSKGEGSAVSRISGISDANAAVVASNSSIPDISGSSASRTKSRSGSKSSSRLSFSEFVSRENCSSATRSSSSKFSTSSTSSAGSSAISASKFDEPEDIRSVSKDKFGVKGTSCCSSVPGAQGLFSRESPALGGIVSFSRRLRSLSSNSPIPLLGRLASLEVSSKALRSVSPIISHEDGTRGCSSNDSNKFSEFSTDSAKEKASSD